ncbi:unnamed protein product [Adineta steineri]|uniref:Uncharacterized protein n=1 Tax=Adineta steineri TaxID=433720 RepID=A0A819AYA6_9BILA|nr:unnamed protein product [Adineta steineri]CAF3791575.1 unnamed protein product [Adineta steineri]
MSIGQYGHTASILVNGLVLVAGGDDSGNDHPKSAELYNPSTGTWAITGSMNVIRRDYTASTLANGSVLVVGGSNGVRHNSAELYNPSTDT